jgi:hypothetical protein
VKLIETKVRLARARFDPYELIDCVAVLSGSARSGEPTLQAFYARLAPFSELFMALFERSRLPQRSTLSRFLGALEQPSVEALRTVFQDDLVARTPFGSPPGGLWERQGKRLYRDRCRWDQTGRQTSGASPDTRPSRPSPPF